MDAATYRRIEHALLHLTSHAERQPSLEETARQVGLSPFHFQRTFRRATGVSPKRFLQHLTLERAKRRLREDRSVLQTSLELGLSGPSRLHDLFVAAEAVTPGQFRLGGQGLTLRFGVHPTALGEVLVGLSPRGVCALEFVEEGFDPKALLSRTYPKARLAHDPRGTAAVVAHLFGGAKATQPLTLHLRGTNFQLQVWRALLRIPAGEVVCYAQIAASIGAPFASRAVGTAIGQNRIALLVPCHRVLQRTGALGGYRWGSPRKRALLALEAAAIAGEGEGDEGDRLTAPRVAPSHVEAGADGREA